MRKRFIVPAALALAAALCLGACSSSYDGKAYGQLIWPTDCWMRVNGDFASTSGFPASAKTEAYKGSQYSLYDGSYHFIYYLVSNVSSSTTYDPYYVEYTIKNESGTRGKPGIDHYYLISCYTTGATIKDTTSYSVSKGITKTVAQADGVPVTIQGDGYTVTLTVKKATLSEAEKASFISLGK
jgi:hypothetical protein